MRYFPFFIPRDSVTELAIEWEEKRKKRLETITDSCETRYTRQRDMQIRTQITSRGRKQWIRSNERKAQGILMSSLSYSLSPDSSSCICLLLPVKGSDFGFCPKMDQSFLCILFPVFEREGCPFLCLTNWIYYSTSSSEIALMLLFMVCLKRCKRWAIGISNEEIIYLYSVHPRRLRSYITFGMFWEKYQNSRDTSKTEIDFDSVSQDRQGRQIYIKRKILLMSRFKSCILSLSPSLSMMFSSKDWL